MYQTTVGKIETAARGIDAVELAVFAQVFEVEVGDLYIAPEEAADRRLIDDLTDEVDRLDQHIEDLKAQLDEARRQRQELVEELGAAESRRANLDGSNRWVMK